jgi:hypothetical protein
MSTDTLGRLVVRVEPAGVWQYPDRAATEVVGLQPDRRPRPPERGAVGAHPEDGDQPRLMPAERSLEHERPARGSSDVTSAAVRVGRKVRFVTPMPCAGSSASSSGRSRAGG